MMKSTNKVGRKRVRSKTIYCNDLESRRHLLFMRYIFKFQLTRTRRTLKPILPKLPDFSEPQREYEILAEDVFNGYGTCYVCDATFYQGIRLWGAHTTGAGLATKIGQLLGDKYGQF